MTSLMEQRTRDILNYAFSGYSKTFEDAMDIITEADISEWTSEQIQERKVLIGMVDNLTSFSVAEEYHMLMDMKEDHSAAKDKDEFDIMAINTFKRYNKTYSNVENKDVLFAASIAATWGKFGDNDIIEFRTQGDERVRASHAILDGLRYRKSAFPDYLTPPLDHGCRCYLLNTGSQDGRTLTNKSNLKKTVDDVANATFSQNVGKTGVVFSESHPYFTIASEHIATLAIAVKNIKKRLGL